MPAPAGRPILSVPFIAWSGTASANPISEPLPELPAPPPNGPVADGDPAFGQHLLDVAVAEQEPEVQPHGVADDLSRKAAPFVRNRRVRWVTVHHAMLPADPVNLTMPRSELSPAGAEVLAREIPSKTKFYILLSIS